MAELRAKWKKEDRCIDLSSSVTAKVIIPKSRGEGSLVEQLKIHNYFFMKKNQKMFTFILCNFLVGTLQYFFLKLKKKTPSKAAHNLPIFFSVMLNRLKTSPTLNVCSIKIAYRVTYV